MVIHNLAQQRFEARVDDEVAFLSYTRRDDYAFFDHTYVPDRFRGKGVAGSLVRAALIEARTQKWKVVPRCTYVRSFLDRNSEFADLVAR